MARKKASTYSKKTLQRRLSKSSFYQSYLGLILGAIVVIIFGFLVANFLTRNVNNFPGQIGTGEKTSASENAQAGGEYKVKEGDSLSAIAEKAYGKQEMWVVLAAKNNIANPDLINVDATLQVPPKDDADTTFMQLTKPTYDVHEGDTLFGIAQSVYGDGSRWMEIARANNVGYLPNGNPLIFAGSTLTIPR